MSMEKDMITTMMVVMMAGVMMAILPQQTGAVTTPGQLVVNTTPPGAAVAVNGETAGISPVTIDLNPGSYNVTLMLAGYNTAIASATISAGVTSILNVPLALEGTDAPFSYSNLQAWAVPNEELSLYRDLHIIATISNYGAAQTRTVRLMVGARGYYGGYPETPAYAWETLSLQLAAGASKAYSHIRQYVSRETQWFIWLEDDAGGKSAEVVVTT